MNWTEVSCYFEGEKTKELYKALNIIYRTESSIAYEDETAFSVLTLTLLKIAKENNAHIFIDDIEFWENENVLHVVFTDTAIELSNFYIKLAQKYNLKLYMRAVGESSEVFINTDDTGKYFPEKYYFSIYDTDTIMHKTDLIKILEEIYKIYGPYLLDLKPFKEYLSEYEIQTEEDVYCLYNYLQETYPSITMYFHKFMNPCAKGE